MVDAIPGLVSAIRMIHSFSRYYNTSEKITSLFYKVEMSLIFIFTRIALLCQPDTVGVNHG